MHNILTHQYGCDETVTKMMQQIYLNAGFTDESPVMSHKL